MQTRVATYLDVNAGAPLSDAARLAILHLLLCDSSAKDTPSAVSSRSIRFEAILPNPSSQHSLGRKARSLLSEAREKVARSWGAGVSADEVIFTSSGTESNQLAIRSELEPGLLRGEKPHWILSKTEHDATLQMVQWLEARGGTVSWLPVDAQGAPQIDALEALWRPETALLSLIWVNNETGVMTDVDAFSRQARAKGVPLHLDGAQAWGKLPLELAKTGARYASFSGHKIGALSGTGALWVAHEPGTARGFQGFIPGSQERGRRGGTENLIGIISLGAAAGALQPEHWAEQVGALRDRLEAQILARIPGARIHGAKARRVSNTLNLGFEGVERDGLVMALDLAGFCVSSGAACSSGIAEPSHVLEAMGLTPDQARSAVRVSLGTENRWEELESFVEALQGVVEKMRRHSRQKATTPT